MNTVVFTFALVVNLVSDPTPTTEVQQRLDQLIDRCHARYVLALTALTADQVSISFVPDDGGPRPGNDKKAKCVFSGLKAMPELKLGFVGNEVE